VSVTDQTGLTASAAVPVVLCAGDFAAVGECAAAFPSVLALRAEPSVIAPGIQGAPAYTDLILEVLDATAVVRYRLTVFDSSGAAVVTLADEPVVGSPSQLVERWLGTSPSGILVDAGVYEARAEVISEVGLRSEASATVTVCRDDQDSPAACVDALMPWQARGGGECAVSTGNSSSSPSSHHLVCLLGLILWFQRRRFRTK